MVEPGRASGPLTSVRAVPPRRQEGSGVVGDAGFLQLIKLVDRRLPARDLSPASCSGFWPMNG